MASRCPGCDGGRLSHHRSLLRLTIAHIDRDAFYASVEKRDRPEFQSRPVIVGGGTRGVVTAACYVARIYGVKSTMPTFKALNACPDAVVIKPDFAKRTAASRHMRALMGEPTPLVQPLSIDEAVLDLSGTEALHGAAPAVVLARFAQRTRAARLSSPTVLPDRLFDLARSLLVKEAVGIEFRLIGIGANPLVPGSTADLGDLADPTTPRRPATQAAIDALRRRFGDAAITRGRSLR